MPGEDEETCMLHPKAQVMPKGKKITEIKLLLKKNSYFELIKITWTKKAGYRIFCRRNVFFFCNKFLKASMFYFSE